MLDQFGHVFVVVFSADDVGVSHGWVAVGRLEKGTCGLGSVDTSVV
jgi:hypothetical protein